MFIQDCCIPCYLALLDCIRLVAVYQPLPVAKTKNQMENTWKLVKGAVPINQLGEVAVNTFLRWFGCSIVSDEEFFSSLRAREGDAPSTASPAQNKGLTSLISVQSSALTVALRASNSTSNSTSNSSCCYSVSNRSGCNSDSSCTNDSTCCCCGSAAGPSATTATATSPVHTHIPLYSDEAVAFLCSLIRQPLRLYILLSRSWFAWGNRNQRQPRSHGSAWGYHTLG